MDELDYLLDRTINFRTYLAPFEGIYINENIIGLIKVLSKNVMEKSSEEIDKFIKKQSVKSFEEQKNQIRKRNFILYQQNGILGDEWENVYRTSSVMNDILKDNISGYSAQKIFNYDKPFIEDIIMIYMKERKVKLSKYREINITNINDFKVFYLFSNNDMLKKCSHQWNLLENTIPFIETIDK